MLSYSGFLRRPPSSTHFSYCITTIHPLPDIFSFLGFPAAPPGATLSHNHTHSSTRQHRSTSIIAFPLFFYTFRAFVRPPLRFGRLALVLLLPFFFFLVSNTRHIAGGVASSRSLFLGGGNVMDSNAHVPSLTPKQSPLHGHLVQPRFDCRDFVCRILFCGYSAGGIGDRGTFPERIANDGSTSDRAIAYFQSLDSPSYMALFVTPEASFIFWFDRRKAISCKVVFASAATVKHGANQQASGIFSTRGSSAHRQVTGCPSAAT